MSETSEQTLPWSSPAFIYGDGGLSIHESLAAAESYLEPYDINEPTVVYDATGAVWDQVVDGWRIRHVPSAEHEVRDLELAGRLRDYLLSLKQMGKSLGDSQWLATAPLDALVREAARLEAQLQLANARAIRGCLLAFAVILAAVVIGVLVWLSRIN
ncbi:MAG TPA: hypothetical protein VGN12_21555 [Pirellulales bacterium]|jgi:hypothetical protein